LKKFIFVFLFFILTFDVHGTEINDSLLYKDEQQSSYSRRFNIVFKSSKEDDHLKRFSLITKKECDEDIFEIKIESCPAWVSNSVIMTTLKDSRGKVLCKSDSAINQKFFTGLSISVNLKTNMVEFYDLLIP
tara:strand:- start:411 stop:806 length:396 start_codon:yes stop_codon:yes gene_type:complete